MSNPVFTTAEALRAVLASTIACSALELQEAVGQIVVATATEMPTRSDENPETRSVFDSSSRVLVLLADRIPVGQEVQALASEIDRHHGRLVAQTVLGERVSELIGDGLRDSESGVLRTAELKGIAFDWAVAAAMGRPISGVFEYRNANGPGLHEFSIKAPNVFTPSRSPGTLQRVEAKVGMSAQALLHAKFGDTVQVPPWVMKVHAEQLAIDAQLEVETVRRRATREALDGQSVLKDGTSLPGSGQVVAGAPAGEPQMFSADDILLARNCPNPDVLFALGKYLGSDPSGQRVTISVSQVVTTEGDDGFRRRDRAGVADETMEFQVDDVMKVSPLHLARLLRTKVSALGEEFESRRGEAVALPALDRHALDRVINVDHVARVGWTWAEELRNSSGYMDRVRAAVKDAVDVAASSYDGVSGTVEMDKWENQGVVLVGNDLTKVRAAARDVASVLFRFEGVCPAGTKPLQAASQEEAPGPDM